jgi:integrin alpha FG-GAP repeat containing protein 1
LSTATSAETFFWLQHQDYVSVPIRDLLQDDAKLQVLDTSFSPAQPIIPRAGDANLDGFPDLLLITEGRVRLLISKRCTRGVPGCAAPGARRGWQEMRKGVDPLTAITDARVAAFVDLDEDGTLDVMVLRTGEQGAGRVQFVQNNFYYDAFFMKAIRACGLSFLFLFSDLSPTLHSRLDSDRMFCSFERCV